MGSKSFTFFFYFPDPSQFLAIFLFKSNDKQWNYLLNILLIIAEG